MLENQQKGPANNMSRGILESKAEKTKSIKEKLDRDRERVAVTPRKQPPKEAAAAAEYDYCNTDSEDCDSDISSDSLRYEEVMGKHGDGVTDTEFYEFNSGVDRAEF